MIDDAVKRVKRLGPPGTKVAVVHGKLKNNEATLARFRSGNEEAGGAESGEPGGAPTVLIAETLRRSSFGRYFGVVKGPDPDAPRHLMYRC